ncbi:hypothetical protein [Mucilaginibacter rubeus]|uniref:hypothetical protein n=1 Tax=Mucilaginibacter rubeus TaxID=2027860 RepID=UPI00166CEA41|nr:hypothetical protein [Mucilaginibacter rubeus]GGA95889.1 hypothetical protein GCM10011500_09610 [Mucilaginibacter rubeus]
MVNKKRAGEVSALSGFGFQYEIFATQIYNHLLNDELEWIEFASERAGKLDDVLIGLPDRIIAYQVKEIASSKFTYSQFTTSDTESIFQGVFRGWRKLKSAYSNKVIDARLITTQPASENDAIPFFNGSPKPSFQKFNNNFWTPIREGRYDYQNLPAVWAPVFEHLKNCVEASAQEVIDFIRDFTFVFDYQLNQVLLDHYTLAKRNGHIESIVKNIFRIVSKQGNVVLNKSQFLLEFGLKNQFETHFQHAFFVDEKHYQPISDTIELLENLINTKAKGYIALLGNAGSGKSTLLTKWLSEGSYRVLKYYVYTNLDMGYDFGYRGEAKYFLHDIITQIREKKFAFQDRLPEKDLLDLQQHFRTEMGNLAKREGKVFILVDGLDHIDREQKVDKSLLEILPHPDAIPDNIYFVLGSRTIHQLNDLHFDIKQDLENSNSIVSISPLNKVQLQQLIESYRLPLTERLFEELLSNTQGHPLFVRYTLEELILADESKYQQIIDSRHFSGDIYTEYQKFWDKYKDEDEFIHILGIIARFRFPYFDTGLLAHFNISRRNAQKVNNVAEFYFYKSENIWQFFHNSFKEFLTQESAKDLFSSKFRPESDKEFHLEIANAIKDVESDYRFNALFHFFKSGRHSMITEMISQQYFREQWFAFRNDEIIFEDIKLAAESAYLEKDQRGVTTCFFAVFELKQRVGNFQLDQFYELFMMVGWLDVASSFVFDRARLLADRKTALHFARLLFSQGHEALAHDLFNRATPIHLLSIGKKVSARRINYTDYSEVNETELVTAWATTASLFMTIPNIVEKVRGIIIEPEGYDEPEEEFLPRVIIDLVYFYLDLKNFEKLTELQPIVKRELNELDQFEFYYKILEIAKKNDKLYREAVVFFDQWQLSDDHDTNLRYALVYTLFEQDMDRSRAAFAALRTPFKLKEEQSRSGGFSLASYIFNYVRLAYIINKDFSITLQSIVPLDDKPSINRFNMAFAELGRSYAWIYYGYKDASAGFFSGFDKLLGAFHYSHVDPEYDYDIFSAKPYLIKLILRVAAFLSDTMVESILLKLTIEWNTNKRYWSNGSIQKIIEVVIKEGWSKSWCAESLNMLDDQIYNSGYLNKRLEEGAKQGELWAMAGDNTKAEITINKLMSLSLDLRGEDDSQLEYIVNWISKFEAYSPAELQYYVDRLDSVSDKVNSRTHTPAITLLELSLNQGNGFSVLEQFAFNGFEDLLDGIESISLYLSNSLPRAKNIALKLFTRFVMALDDNHGARRNFIYSFFKSNPDLQQIKELVIDTEIYAVYEYREDYLFEIQERVNQAGLLPASVGIVKKIEKKRENSSYANSIRLKTGEVLTEEAIQPTIYSISDIEQLQQNEAEYSHFDYTNLLIKIIPGASASILERYISEKELEPRNAIEIASALRNSGHPILARKILLNSFKKSRYSGWGSIFDVNQKYKLYKALETVESINAVQDLAFKDFSSNITFTNLREMELVLKDLDKTFELFFDQVDKDQIYHQVVQFRDELLKNHFTERRVEIQGAGNDADLLIDLVYFLITFPATLYETIFSLLIEESERLHPEIDTIIERLFADGYTLKYVMLLSSLSRKDLSIIEKQKDNLLALVQTNRFDVFILAVNLLNKAQIDWDRQPLTRETPLGYKLQLHREMGIVDGNKQPVDNIDENGLLKATQDPLMHSRIFSGEIISLARATGFTPYNIAYRIKSLDGKLQFPQWCTNCSEEEIVNKLNRMNLHIPYKRPQIQGVIDGFAKVLMELYDLNLIDTNLACELLPYFDECCYFVKSVRRPSFVGTIITKHGSAPSTDRKWPKELTKEYLRNASPLSWGKRIILAEKTVLGGMAHGTAVETRQAFVDVLDWDQNEAYWIFPDKQQSSFEYYPHLEGKGICIYNDVKTTNSKDQWIAVNPHLAHDMGLTYNPSIGCFRWDDKNGNMVIESLYWMEGDSLNKNSHHHSETGQGWVVLITEEGYSEMSKILNGRKLFHHRKINRELRFNQRQYGTHIDEKGEYYYWDEVESLSPGNV